jgi:proline iminopeptidase
MSAERKDGVLTVGRPVNEDSMSLYPAIEPYASGMLDVEPGNRIYWETCGNPNGKPAVIIHGGPGSGCTPQWRRLFDPEAYRIILFDQRGCGRSEPHASDPATGLTANTTDHLISDMERLRRALDVERWLLFGGSWGTTLTLAYAELHRRRVTEMVLLSITTTGRREVEWITRDVGRLFPEAWERFRDGVPPADRDGSLVEAYSRLLNHPDAEVRKQAAREWCAWEEVHVAVLPGHRPNRRYEDPRFRMCFARLVTHYWRHAAWLEDGQLLRGAGELAGIPGVLIHGRLDVSSPADIAWSLARAWSGSELTLIDAAGHGAGHADVYRLLRQATDRFSRS